MTHCNSATGACVGCLASSQCAADAPVCDAMTKMCRACTADTECDSGVCDLAGGTCVTESSVVYASPSGTQNNACTKLDACALGKAFMLVGATKNIVKMASGTYPTTIALTGSQPITVYGAGATMTSTLAITGSATIKIRDLSFLGDGGLYCVPASVGAPMPTFDLDRVSFDTTGTTSSGPFAIQANPCTLDIKRSKFKITGSGGEAIYASGELANSNGATANRGTAVSVDRSWFEGGEPAISLGNSSVLHMTNSLTFGSTPMYAAIGSDPSGTGTIDFSTLLDWSWYSGNGPVRFVVTNSIFYNPRILTTANTFTGGAEFHYSLLFPQHTGPLGTNNMVGIDPMLADPANQDFHLVTGSPAIDAGDPGATAPLDYEGTVRPQGARRDIGAFEYR
ncbi:MAG: hypothetical protein JWO36_1466 [Myxococcales bacterium]|nr:hypothetical protein [Myxococcales bacterium]